MLLLTELEKSKIQWLYNLCGWGEAPINAVQGGRKEGKLRSFGERVGPVPSSRLAVRALQNLCYRGLAKAQPRACLPALRERGSPAPALT